MADINWENIDKTLEGLEWSGVNYLYNLEPKANNLFYVGNLSTSGNQIWGNSENEKQPEIPLPNTRFRVHKISFPFTKLDFDGPNLEMGIPTPLISGVKRATSCSITWIDDERKLVERYHHIWMRSWYRRETGLLKNGAINKFRNLRVYPFRYVTKHVEATPYLSTMVKPQVLYEIKLFNLVPTNIQSVEYDMNEPGDALVTYEYNLNMSLSTSRKLGKDDIIYDVDVDGIDGEANITYHIKDEKKGTGNGVNNGVPLYL